MSDEMCECGHHEKFHHTTATNKVCCVGSIPCSCQLFRPAKSEGEKGMSEQEQRIAIAEFCGWKWRWKDSQQLVSQWSSPKDNSRFFDNELPEYLRDLNAIHEAVEKLRENQFHYVNYWDELFKVVTGMKWTGLNLGYFGFTFIQATASQRAEALLRTIGKWKD